MEQYLQPEFVKNFLIDLCSIHLTIIGVCLTIFTLLYSFIFSKRTELEVYSDALKSKMADPLIAQKYGQIVRYISGLTSIIQKCKYPIFLSCSIWIICWVDKMFIFPIPWRHGLLVFAIVASLIEALICGYWILLIMKQYHRDINI